VRQWGLKVASFTAEFIFHNVGQGLFYSGRVGSFNFVYDCGAEKRGHLYAVINNYKNNELQSSKLDLLILSHLHDDHVSGLNVLLDRISVNTVILPYLSPIERLMVALRNEYLPLWFYEFLADPVSFLIDKGARKVVLMGGREARPPERVGFESGPDLNEMPDDEELREEVLEHDKHWKSFLDQRKLLVRNHNRDIGIQGIWVLRFYNCKIDDSNKDSFERCVRSAVGTNDLIHVIRSKPRLGRLRACYNGLQKDFNNTSLVLYHAPMDKSMCLCKVIGNCCEAKDFPESMFVFANGDRAHLHKANGQFLTGDINLGNAWNGIQIHYGSYLSEVFVALLPHHGSKRNWNRVILTKVPRKCRWVASSGLSNRYGHPSPEVFRDAIQRGGVAYWCNELNMVSMHCCNVN